MVLILARHNPDDTFYIVGQNQWDALEIENKIREKLFVQEEQTEEKVEEPTKKSKVTADNETAK